LPNGIGGARPEVTWCEADRSQEAFYLTLHHGSLLGRLQGTELDLLGAVQRACDGEYQLPDRRRRPDATLTGPVSVAPRSCVSAAAASST